MRKVILVHPEGPRNVGMVLRTATNFGSVDIVLVAPRRPSILVHPDFEQMSHGVEDAARRVTVVETLEEALADCTHAVGFTARPRVHRHFADWRDAAPAVAELASSDEECVALVFGNEVEGLAQVETDLCHELVHIRTAGEHTSLNLSMAVGVALFSTFTERGVVRRAKAHNSLTGEARLFLKERMKAVFQKVARSDSIRRDIGSSIDRVISTAPLETRDGRAWHAILRVLGGESRPGDFGLEERQAAGARREAALERNRGAEEEESA